MQVVLCIKGITRGFRCNLYRAIMSVFGMRLIVTFFIVDAFSIAIAQTSSNFELFKDQISKPAAGYKVEFFEGDIDNKSSISVIKMNGRILVHQPQRHYYATCQSNAFLLIQKPETVALDEKHTNVSLFTDYGRYNDSGWLRSDSAFVRMVDMHVESTNLEIQNIAEQVRDAESKAQCACSYGLPYYDASTIKWDGHKFSAKTFSGSVMNGEVNIDRDSGLVYALSYDLNGKTLESGSVFYSYSDKKIVSLLPDVIEKRINQSDPMFAARNSFRIKILHYNVVPTAFERDIFTSSIQDANYLISNGIPLTQLGGKFLSSNEVAKVTTPYQSSNSRPARIFMALFLAFSFIILGLVFRSITKKTKKE